MRGASNPNTNGTRSAANDDEVPAGVVMGCSEAMPKMLSSPHEKGPSKEESARGACLRERQAGHTWTASWTIANIVRDQIER